MVTNMLDYPPQQRINPKCKGKGNRRRYGQFQFEFSNCSGAE